MVKAWIELGRSRRRVHQNAIGSARITGRCNTNYHLNFRKGVHVAHVYQIVDSLRNLVRKGESSVSRRRIRRIAGARWKLTLTNTSNSFPRVYQFFLCIYIHVWVLLSLKPAQIDYRKLVSIILPVFQTV